jgi:hypothetical protein
VSITLFPDFCGPAADAGRLDRDRDHPLLVLHLEPGILSLDVELKGYLHETSKFGRTTRILSCDKN